VTKHSVNQILYFGTATATPVSEGKGFTVNISTQFADDTSWGDTFQTQKPGIQNATAQLMKHYDHAETTLANAAQQRTEGRFYWYQDRADATNYVYWMGYVSGGGIQAGSLNEIIGQTYDIVFSGQPTWVRA
jgi:hypothetical protein